MLSRACYEQEQAAFNFLLFEVDMSFQADFKTHTVMYGKLRTAITRFVPEQMLVAAKGCLLRDC